MTPDQGKAITETILNIVDTFAPHVDIQHFKDALADYRRRLHISQSIGFIAGGNNFKEEKAKLEIEVLNALTSLLESRQKQILRLPILMAAEQERQANIQKIMNIL